MNPQNILESNRFSDAAGAGRPALGLRWPLPVILARAELRFHLCIDLCRHVHLRAGMGVGVRRGVCTDVGRASIHGRTREASWLASRLSASVEGTSFFALAPAGFGFCTSRRVQCARAPAFCMRRAAVAACDAKASNGGDAPCLPGTCCGAPPARASTPVRFSASANLYLRWVS